MNRANTDLTTKSITLTPRQNNELAMKAKNGNRDAATELMLANSGLVYTIAKSFGNSYVIEDLKQEGYLGLLKAVKKYETNRGAFTTYAYYWIRAYMIQFMQTLDPIVYSRAFKEKKAKYEELKKKKKSGNSKINEEDLKKAGLTMEEINDILSHDYEIYSLEGIAEFLENDGGIADPYAHSVDHYLLVAEMQQALINEMERLLSPKYNYIIRLYYGIGCAPVQNMTIIAELVSKKFGGVPVSRQRISTIIRAAKLKLKESEILHDLVN